MEQRCFIFESVEEEYEEETSECLFCEREKVSNRKCCSPECTAHLDDCLKTSLPENLAKRLLSLDVEKKVEELKLFSKKQGISLEATFKLFQKTSKRLGLSKQQIQLTPKIASYIKITGTIPTSLLHR